MIVSPGMPKASIGTNAEPRAALFAAAAPAIGSMCRSCLLSFFPVELFFVAAYEIQAAMSEPAPGMAPTTPPIPEPMATRDLNFQMLAKLSRIRVVPTAWMA